MADGRLIFDTLLDTTGIRKGIEKVKAASGTALKGAQSLFEQTGGKLTNFVKGISLSTDEMKGLGTAFEQTGGKLTKFITKPALGAAAAIAGIGLVKGWNRLTAIDDAKVKLEALLHDGKAVEEVMNNALASVKGTAYGLGDAATTAASAVASGIKPGAQLTQYLKTVADTAAVAGVGMAEMGSIFNKVAAKGKVDAEILNQLSDAGVPALQLLANELGVTTAEVSKMVSAGEVDFATFQKAMAAGVDGAAVMMGEKTVTGALANIGASLSRIGANFLDAGGKGGGFFSQLQPLLVELMEWMGGLEDKASVLGEKFGSAFATVIKVLRSVPAPVLAIGTALTVSAGPAMQLTGKILKTTAAIKTFKTEEKAMSTLAGIANGKLTVQQALAMKLVSSFKHAATSVKGFVTSMAKKIASTATDTASTVANTVATAANGTAASGAAKKVLAFASAHKVALAASLGAVGALAAMAIYMAKTGMSADQMADKITGFADVAAAAITSFANALPKVLPKLTAALVKAINSVVATLPTLIPAMVNAGITLFMGLVDALPTVIQALTVALPGIITAVVTALVNAVPALIQAGITLFMALVQAIPTVINALVAALPQIITAIVNAIPVLIPALIQAGITLFMALIQAIPTVASALIRAMPQIISAIVKGLLAGIGQIFNVGVTLLKRLWSGISSWGGSLKSKVLSLARSLPGKIKDGIGSLASIGKNWIEGLWNGIGSKKTWLCNKIKSLASDAKNAIKDFFGIHSPSTVMEKEVGRFIPEGLGVGIIRNTKGLLAQVRTQAAEVKSAYAEGLNGGVLTAIGSRFTTRVEQRMPGASEATNVEQTFNFYQEAKSPIAIARELKKQALFGLAGDY